MIRAAVSLLLVFTAAPAAATEENGLDYQNWVEFHGKKYDSNDHQVERMQIWLENDGM